MGSTPQDRTRGRKAKEVWNGILIERPAYVVNAKVPRARPMSHRDGRGDGDTRVAVRSAAVPSAPVDELDAWGDLGDEHFAMLLDFFTHSDRESVGFRLIHIF